MQRFLVKAGKDRLEPLRDLRIGFQHRFAHHGRRGINRLYALRIAERLQPQRRHRPVGSVGHCRIHPGSLLGRRFDGHRRIAPRQRQQLTLLELEAIGFFKGRERIRTFDKFGGGGELKVAPFLQPGAEIGQRGQMIFFRQILTHGNGPGVIGRRRRQPDKLILLRVEGFDLLITLLRVLPRRVVFVFKEEGAVAGVFRINV